MRRAIVIALAVALFAALVVEVLMAPEPGGDLPPWHTSPGWFGVYSVVGCAALVAVAKLLGRLGLARPEPDDDPGDDPHGDVAHGDAPRDPAAPEEPT